MDPDLALFSIYGSGSRPFYDTKINVFHFFIKCSCLFHVSFDYEEIPLKEMKISKKLQTN